MFIYDNIISILTMSKQRLISLDAASDAILEKCKENPYFNFSVFVREALKQVTFPLTLAKE